MKCGVVSAAISAASSCHLRKRSVSLKRIQRRQVGTPVTDPLDNDLTPIAEILWKLYTQLLRAGFERTAAMEITIAALKQMLSQMQAAR